MYVLSKIEIIERQNNALHKLNEIAAISHINPKETLRQALMVGKEYYGLEFTKDKYGVCARRYCTICR